MKRLVVEEYSFLEKIEENKRKTVLPKFNLNQQIKVIIKRGDDRKGGKRFSGKVIFTNNKLIIIQGKNYRESINLIDFVTGMAVLISA